MPSRTSLAVLTLVGLAAAASIWTLVRTRPETPASAPSVPPAPPAAAQAVAPVVAPTRTPTRPEEMIHYPDGTYMPALNGVQRPGRLNWPPELPFSPIIGKRASSDGTEWYVHADGTCTTTMMLWRSDLGRKDAITHVARPLPAAPVEDTSR